MAFYIGYRVVLMIKGLVIRIKKGGVPYKVGFGVATLTLPPTYPQSKLTFNPDDYGKKGSITPPADRPDFF